MSSPEFEIGQKVKVRSTIREIYPSAGVFANKIGNHSEFKIQGR